MTSTSKQKKLLEVFQGFAFHSLFCLFIFSRRQWRFLSVFLPFLIFKNISLGKWRVRAAFDVEHDDYFKAKKSYWKSFKVLLFIQWFVCSFFSGDGRFFLLLCVCIVPCMLQVTTSPKTFRSFKIELNTRLSLSLEK